MYWALKGRAHQKNPCTVRCVGQSNRVPLTPEQAHDLEGADKLLPNLLETIPAFLADTAVDMFDSIRTGCERNGQ